jgi:two-component system sensor histidine kinase YesM
MKFQNKLILTYSLFITIILLIVGLVFYRINLRFFNNNINSTYTLLNKGLVRQLDDLYDQMDFMLLNFLSEEDVKSVINTLNAYDHSEDNFAELYNDALEVFRSRLLTYSIIKNYQSIIFFNSKGDFFSSNFSDHDFYTIPPYALKGLPWVETVESQKNSKIIIAPYKDPWSDDYVFGLGRKIFMSGSGSTYITAQKKMEDLRELVSIEKDENISLLIRKDNGDLFYSSPGLNREEAEYILRLEDFSSGFIRNPVSGIDEQYFSLKSDETGLQSILIVQQDILSASTLRMGLLIFTGFLIISLVSLLYNIYSSRFLTRPLREITRIMGGTELNKTPESIDMNVHHDEVLDLSKAFYELVERLKKANKREVHYTTAWLQAKFDALQEQINPHFIFNTLTVISKRAFEIGDDDICETCDSLADMLRYSTSTASRSALVSDEIALTRNYLLLMKKRLGKRLNYRFQIDDILLNLSVPKIVLHQLVENALNHGFTEIKKDMEIVISVVPINTAEWCFRVEDNGQGFENKTLNDLENQISHIIDDPPEEHFGEGFQIGGLGLVNTFLRLYLYYKGGVDLKIVDRPEGGSSVSFIIPINGESNV